MPVNPRICRGYSFIYPRISLGHPSIYPRISADISKNIRGFEISAVRYGRILVEGHGTDNPNPYRADHCPSETSLAQSQKASRALSTDLESVLRKLVVVAASQQGDFISCFSQQGGEWDAEGAGSKDEDAHGHR